MRRPSGNTRTSGRYSGSVNWKRPEPGGYLLRNASRPQAHAVTRAPNPPASGVGVEVAGGGVGGVVGDGEAVTVGAGAGVVGVGVSIGAVTVRVGVGVVVNAALSFTVKSMGSEPGA